MPSTKNIISGLTDVFAYVGMFFVLFLILRQLLRVAKLQILKPKPAVKEDDFMKEYGYSYDFAFVFAVVDELDRDDINDYQRKNSMKIIVDRLQSAGLETHCFYSCQRDEVYVKIRATPQRLLIEAENVNYKFQLDPDRLKVKAQTGKPGFWKKIVITDEYEVSEYEPWDHIYGPYSMDPELSPVFRQYEVQDEKKYPFREVDRLKLLLIIFESKVSANGCGLFLGDLIVHGALLAILPIHNYDALDALQLKWLSLFAWPWTQPLTDVKDYYGERIGLYFAYMGFYCTGLMPVAALGAGAFVIQKISGSVEHPVLPAFAVIMCLWSTAFMDYWAQYQSKLAMEWGMTGFEAEELDRPQFEGMQISSPIDGSPLTYFKDEEKKQRLNTVQAIIGFSLLIVVSCVSGTFALQYVMSLPQYVELFTVQLGAIAFNFGTVITPILNAVVIAILNIVYMMMVYDLNDYENHRTETDYEDALVAKVFIFQLVNSFAALTYIAFIKGYLGWSFHCIGPGGDCLSDVSATLATVFISREISALITQVFVRKLLMEMKEAAETSGLEPGVKASPLEQQYCLAPYDILKDALVDYAGLVIQYGYMILFVTAFPLSVTLAWASTYIQIRVDGWKFCQCLRRPMPKSAEDIGMWQDMVVVISTIAVSFNMGLIFFTGFYMKDFSWQMRWIMFVSCEHVLFATKIYIQNVIDDVTEDVDIQLQRQQFLVDKVLNNLKDDDDEELEKGVNDELNLIIERTDLGWVIPEDEEAAAAASGGEGTGEGGEGYKSVDGGPESKDGD